MTFVRSGLFVVATAFALAGCGAGTRFAGPQRIEAGGLVRRCAMEVISSISEFKPGDQLPRHIHHGIETGYVVQGAMVQVPGQAPMMLETGAPIMNLRDVPHGGFKVIGPGSLKLYTAHIVDEAEPLHDWVK
jgi:hypothetical protein